MISNICYTFVFLVETLISFYYFDFKFERKITKKSILLFMTVNFSILYILHFCEIPIVNLLGFFACNFLVSRICYKTKLKTALFNNLILLFLMIVTEIIVFYFSSINFRIDLFESYNDDYILIIQAVICKLLYFLSVHLIIKISQNENTDGNSKFSILLCILPIASIILMHTTIYLCIIYPVNEKFKLSLVLGNLLLLFSNIIVFYINELIIKYNHKYTQILLDKQKEKNTSNYYELLREQNENSKVLIHDITRHLNTVKQLSEDKDSNIAKYISEIVNDFSVMNPIDYCNNPTVNLITHRYYEICKKNNINFSINIKNANIDFIKEHDITALLDNLLENAVESALQTNDKFIDFSICTRNSNFVIIKVSNSCNKKPKYINGNLVSSKNTSCTHGIGTRSIKRVVAKYSGNLEMKYDSDSNTFTSTIGLNSNSQTINQQ